MLYKFKLEGMHCNACIEKIRTTLAPHLNISKITLNPPQLDIEAKSPPTVETLNIYLASAGKYSVHAISKQAHSEKRVKLKLYYPIYLIAVYIAGVAFINNNQEQAIHWHGFMNQFMAGFFLVFSAFKLLNLKGFAEGYAQYDLLAQRWYLYGFLYPFFELSLGILYLSKTPSQYVYIATIILMGFSSLGVINSLRKNQTIQCACLGTILKIPLSSITLIEDLTMVFMAGLSLVALN
jgi:hypothetical protein